MTLQAEKDIVWKMKETQDDEQQMAGKQDRID